MSMKHGLSRVLGFLLLFPFLFAAVPEYDEWDELDSDDSLDLFVMPQKSAASKTMRRDRLVVWFSSLFCSKTYPIHSYNSGNIYSRPFTLELILSVTLRC